MRAIAGRSYGKADRNRRGTTTTEPGYNHLREPRARSTVGIAVTDWRVKTIWFRGVRGTGGRAMGTRSRWRLKNFMYLPSSVFGEFGEWSDLCAGECWQGVAFLFSSIRHGGNFGLCRIRWAYVLRAKYAPGNKSTWAQRGAIAGYCGGDKLFPGEWFWG